MIGGLKKIVRRLIKYKEEQCAKWTLGQVILFRDFKLNFDTRT